MNGIATHLATGAQVLSNGRLGMLDGPRFVYDRCDWLVEVASGNPEPDSYEDTVRVVPCGELLTAGTTPGHMFTCDAGHDRWEYGTREAEYLLMEVDR